MGEVGLVGIDAEEVVAGGLVLAVDEGDGQLLRAGVLEDDRDGVADLEPVVGGHVPVHRDGVVAEVGG